MNQYIIEVGGLANRPQIIRHFQQSADRADFALRRQILNRALQYLHCKLELSAMIEIIFKHYHSPNLVEAKINQFLMKNQSDKECLKCVVLGVIEDRILIFYTPDYQALVISLGCPVVDLLQSSLPSFIEYKLNPIEPNICQGTISQGLIKRVKEPKVALGSLYHPDVFPLPRLALGISCLARALRKELLGQVYLFDMQLGLNLEELYQKLIEQQPDIIGISATFGQQDLLEALLTKIYDSTHTCQVIVGGSLSALNKKTLLAKFPNLVIAIGSGEATIVEFIKLNLGELDRAEVNGVAYLEGGAIKINQAKSNREFVDILPELDLLPSTLKNQGVMQLESSRGCSYACSFCPRTHKGIWAGDSPVALAAIMPYVDEIFRQHSNCARKIFLVDEEFVGYNRASESRVKSLSNILAENKFRYETSSRIDQVYRTNKSQQWHYDRMQMWRDISTNSMSRCLFGVESGVDSILQRFNKKTTKTQNVLAIRLLSALAIPTRFTYITFDHLMTLSELVETYRFLGRTDLLLKPIVNMKNEDIFASVHDVRSVDRFSEHRPFYEEVSYMLVSMENLMEAPYSRLVEAKNLTTGINAKMGRLEANFECRVIGLFSHYSQCWIDRNFALDYAFKSVQKYSDALIGAAIHDVRKILRRYSYELLGQFLYMETADSNLLPSTLNEEQYQIVIGMQPRWLAANDEASQARLLCFLMDRHIECLIKDIDSSFSKCMTILPVKSLHVLMQTLVIWKHKQDWTLING